VKHVSERNFVSETSSYQLKQPETTQKEGETFETQQQSKMSRTASSSNGWIDWRRSAARAILLRDLEPGGPLAEMDGKVVWTGRLNPSNS
jgi:hypothetical protein